MEKEIKVETRLRPKERDSGGQVKTRDIWQSAFMLARGGELKGVEAGGNGARVVMFIFGGPGAGALAQEFRSGQAMCNVARLRASMIHLKEVMFERLNE